jgi:hypothetical protein
MDQQGRFRDPLIRLYELAAEGIDVACPRCHGHAVDTARPTEDIRRPWWWPRRLACHGCGYSAVWNEPREGSVRRGPIDPFYRLPRWGGPVDPYFGCPLWLRAKCCGGQTLWAFNRRHLDLLVDYVAARLRERGPEPGGMTLVARLPEWLKSARNRDEVLRVIDRLRASLDN